MSMFDKYFAEGRKVSGIPLHFSQVALDAIVAEMKIRKVAFLPRQVVRKVVCKLSISDAEKSFAISRFQRGLGLAPSKVNDGYIYGMPVTSNSVSENYQS